MLIFIIIYYFRIVSGTSHTKFIFNYFRVGNHFTEQEIGNKDAQGLCTGSLVLWSLLFFPLATKPSLILMFIAGSLSSFFKKWILLQKSSNIWKGKQLYNKPFFYRTSNWFRVTYVTQISSLLSLLCLRTKLCFRSKTI